LKRKEESQRMKHGNNKNKITHKNKEDMGTHILFTLSRYNITTFRYNILP
jgi:hypothetical protein